MKKKNIFLWIITLVIFVFLPSILFLFSSLSLIEWNFMFSWRINNFLEKYFENEIIKERKWDYYYKLWKYDKALESYSQIKCETKADCSKLFHNIWNTFFRLWETSQEREKINFWQKSLEAYQKSLNLIETKETRDNYNFVKKQLEDLIKNQNKEKEEEKKEEDKKEENKENTEEEKSEENDSQNQDWSSWNSWTWESQSWESSWNNQQNTEQSESWEEQVIPKWQSMWLGWDEGEAQKELSQDEIQAINEYLKSLEQEEKENMRLNKPQKNTWDMFNDFFDFENWFWWDDYDW